MKRSIVAALAILAFGTLVTTAHAQTLVTPPAWLNTSVGATTDRDLAYNPATGNLLLTRSSPAILRLKSSDGTSAGADMDLTGVSGGTLTVSGIAVLDDGTIFACNYVTGAQSATPLKIYQWNNETGQATMVASVTGMPGTTADRFGAAMDAFVRPGVSTNLLIAGNTTNAWLAIFDSNGWTFKQLTFSSYTQSLVPSGSFVDYGAPGYANQFRVVGKSRGAGGRLYSFDPAATSPIAMSSVAMGAPFTFVANGITSHDYNPATRLLAGTTSTVQASPWSFTNILCSTVNGVASPTVLSSVTSFATGADGGQACATVLAGDGRLYTAVSAAGGGVTAFDITAFLVSNPGSVIATNNDPSAALSPVFGGSSLSFTWKRGSDVLYDPAKYSGTNGTSLTISNLALADAGTYTVTVSGPNSSSATASVVLFVNSGPVGNKTWNGGSATTDNWTDKNNWGGTGLNFGGDSAFFDGNVRTSPVMDGSYDVNGITFNPGAARFNITASGGTLSLSGGITNNSATAEEVLSLPISISAARVFNAAANSLVVSNAISGGGGITKLGAYTLALRGSSPNTFNGLMVSAGSVLLGKSPGTDAVAGTITAGPGTTVTLEGSNQIPDASLVDLQAGNGTLSLADGVTDTIRGFLAGPSNTQTNSGTVQLGVNARLTVQPSLTVGYCAVPITAANPSGTKFIVDSAGGEVRWTPTNMVNSFEKLIIQNSGRLRCGHGGNAWLPQDTMLGSVPASFLQDQITINNGTLGMNSSLVPTPITAANTLYVNANRGLTISGNATLETYQNVVFPGRITGTGTLIHIGGADLALLGANDYSGGTQVGGGSITVNSASALGSGPVKFTSNSGALAVSVNGLAIPNPIDLSTAITNSFGTYYNGTNFTLSGNVDLGSVGSDPQISVTSAGSIITFTGTLTNTLGLVKGGPGKAILAGANTYGGNTEILKGALFVNNTSGSGTSSGGVGVDAAGTLGGTGNIAGQVTVYGTLSPGSSVGTLTTADQTWQGGGHYAWQMNDANGSAGSSPGWDKIVINGTLNIAASPGSQFIIDITSLNGAAPGNAANYNNALPHTWVIATATAGITGFDPAAFSLVTSGFSNPLGGAYFTIETSGDGNSLIIRQNVATVGTGTGLMGAYYNLAAFTDPPASIPDPPVLERLDQTINFDWGTGSPGEPVTADYFAVRWMGQVQPMQDQTYTFIANTDDGVRLWVDGQEIINNWILKAPSDTFSMPLAMVGGRKYQLVMEYFEHLSGAVAKLSWQTPGRGPEIIPQTQLYPATAPVQPAVSLSEDRAQMTLSWSGTYTLQWAADLVNGPWAPVTGSSPCTITIDVNQPQIFYRLVSQ